MDFPGGPVVKTLHFHCRGYEFDPGWRTKISQATQCGQKKKKKKTIKKINRYCQYVHRILLGDGNPDSLKTLWQSCTCGGDR